MFRSPGLVNHYCVYYYVIFTGGQNIDVALRDQAAGVCCQNRPDFEEATWD